MSRYQPFSLIYVLFQSVKTQEKGFSLKACPPSDTHTSHIKTMENTSFVLILKVLCTHKAPSTGLTLLYNSRHFSTESFTSRMYQRKSYRGSTKQLIYGYNSVVAIHEITGFFVEKKRWQLLCSFRHIRPSFLQSRCLQLSYSASLKYCSWLR